MDKSLEQMVEELDSQFEQIDKDVAQFKLYLNLKRAASKAKAQRALKKYPLL